MGGSDGLPSEDAADSAATPETVTPADVAASDAPGDGTLPQPDAPADQGKPADATDTLLPDGVQPDGPFPEDVPDAQGSESVPGDAVELAPDGEPWSDAADADALADTDAANQGDPTALLCLPCQSDEQCVVEQYNLSGLCVDFGPSGSYCATACGGQACPLGFVCAEVLVGGTDVVEVCMPADGQCECPDPLPVKAAVTTCFQQNAHGKCLGERWCLAGEPLSECTAATPAVETCNGKDDDCSGEADDGLPLLSCGVGACAATTPSCVDGKDVPCVPLPPAPDDPCDGIDNDCDGVVDQGFVDTDGDLVPDCLDDDDDGDGAADVLDNCPLVAQTEFSDFDADGLGDACDDDGDNDGTPDAQDCGPLDATVFPGAAESCNLVDDDCDSEVDEGFGETTCGTGQCVVTLPNCLGGQMKECEPLPPLPELCDGLDNDCDGAKDDGFLGLGDACDGPDADSCKNGKTVCSPDGVGVMCGAESPTNLVELCYDGIDNDCVGWTPDACVLASCKALKANNPGIASGVYPIDPDVGGPIPQFNVYCDMAGNGGGWTLVLKANGAATTFLYTSALWTNEQTYNPGSPNLDGTEAKLASFSTVPFTEVRVGFAVGNSLQWLVLPKTANSMLEVMKGAYQASAAGRNAWKNLIPGSSLQLNCNKEGFNVLDPCSWDTTAAGVARARIGIIGNEQIDCCSADSRIGIGTMGGYCGQDTNNSAGNEASPCTPDNGEKHIKAVGYVMVR